MKTYTELQIRKKLTTFVGRFPTATAAAEEIGITRAELSIAMRGGRIPHKALKALGVQKVEVYTDG